MSGLALALSFLALSLSICPWQLAYAAHPAPIGGLSAVEKLKGSEVFAHQATDTAFDPQTAPIIVDMAKFIVREMADRGFIFIDSPTPGHQGINLQLLYMNAITPLKLPAGSEVAKIPIRPNPHPDTVGSPSVKIQAPALRPDDSKFKIESKKDQAIREAADSPKVSLPENETPAATSPHTMGKTKMTDRTNAQGQLQMPRDTARNLPENQFNQKNQADGDSLRTSATSLAMGFPVAKQNGAAEDKSKYAFLMWTLPQSDSLRVELPQVADDSSYQGTFVECKAGTKFSSMSGRSFKLAQGAVLAFNQAPAPLAKLSFDTDLAKVELGEGAAAILDFSDGSNLRVMALSGSDTKLVQVEIKSSAEKIQLETGQGLIISKDKLSSKDLEALIAYGQRLVSDTGSGNLARFSFDINTVVEKSELFNVDSGLLEPKKVSALSGLKKHLIEMVVKSPASK
jgi:hypothetical protein